MELSLVNVVPVTMIAPLSELMTIDVFNSANIRLNISELSNIESGYKLRFSSLPRDGQVFVGRTLSDLLGNGNFHESEPNEWLILSVEGELTSPSYWSGQDELGSTEILAYRCALEFVQQLRAYADHVAIDGKCTVLTIFDVERLDINVLFGVRDLRSAFPVDELREFLDTESSSVVRIEAFKGTLWDFLKDFEPNERLPRLLRGGSDFLRRLKRNFAIARADYRLDRRLEIARKELTEFSDTVSKIVLGLEAKAFAIPGALILSARVVKLSDGWSLPNVSILVGTLLVAIILTSGYFSQREIIRSLKSEILDAKSRLDVESNDKNLADKFDSLTKRISLAGAIKIIIVIAAWALFIAMAIILSNTVVV